MNHQRHGTHGQQHRGKGEAKTDAPAVIPKRQAQLQAGNKQRGGHGDFGNVYGQFRLTNDIDAG